MFEIVRYRPEYEEEVMRLMEREGEDWSIYWKEPNASRYRKALSDSVTYLALADGKVCGYSRSVNDALFVYVCDLLVSADARGNGLGKRLMQCARREYPDCPIYIISGNDGYYQKINCKKEGSIYLLGED